MPTLILSPTYNEESKILREAAGEMGWATFRFAVDGLPRSFRKSGESFALYCTVPRAFSVARSLDSVLLGCSADWLPDLPVEFTGRSIRKLALRDVLDIEGSVFIKPALGKSFDASVTTRNQLLPEVAHLPGELEIHVSEIVEWEEEYRCFVLDGAVRTIGAYRLGVRNFSGYDRPLVGDQSRIDGVLEFANGMLALVDAPRAFVLDVGWISGHGWAVVEPNECWGAGIYGCSPELVLEVLAGALVTKKSASDADMLWDYERHYFEACPHMIE